MFHSNFSGMNSLHEDVLGKYMKVWYESRYVQRWFVCGKGGGRRIRFSNHRIRASSQENNDCLFILQHMLVPILREQS